MTHVGGGQQTRAASPIRKKRRAGLFMDSNESCTGSGNGQSTERLPKRRLKAQGGYESHFLEGCGRQNLLQVSFLQAIRVATYNDKFACR
jgi:hypothetical protein